MESELFSRPNNQARIHDFEQFTFWSNVPGRPNQRARISFGERNGAPRISVFTGDKGSRQIYAGFGPVEFEIFLDIFLKVAEGPSGSRSCVENLDRDPTSTQETVIKVTRNRLFVGKNDEGVVWIGFEQGDQTKVAFKMLPNGWHNFIVNGLPLEEAEMSVAYTKGLIAKLRSVTNFWAARIRPWVNRSENGAVSAGGVSQKEEPRVNTTAETFNDISF